MTGPATTTTTTERWSRANHDMERRATPRDQVLLPALIVLPDGGRRPCVIVDRSEGGLRISLPTGDSVPNAFCVIDLVSGIGREMEVAWRHADNVGLRTVRTHDLDLPQDGIGETLRQVRIAVLG
jgi:hypothetical protein